MNVGFSLFLAAIHPNFSIFKLLDVYSYSLPYPCHTAQDSFRGTTMLLLSTLLSEVPYYCSLDFRSAVISITVTVI